MENEKIIVCVSLIIFYVMCGIKWLLQWYCVVKYNECEKKNVRWNDIVCYADCSDLDGIWQKGY